MSEQRMASVETLKRQLDKALRRIQELEALQDATTDPLIIELARALHWASIVGDPAAPSTALDDTGGSGKPGSRPPASSGDRHVRRHVGNLRWRVQQQVDVFWSNVDNPTGRKQAAPQEQADVTDGVSHKIRRFRCRMSGCGMRDKRQPGWGIDEANGSLVVHDKCAGCGEPFPKHPANATS